MEITQEKVIANLMGSNSEKYKAISVKRFREHVNSIEDDDARTVIETYYLAAGRLCELSCITNPSEMRIGASRPYGLFNTFKIEDFEVTPKDNPALSEAVSGKVLVLNLATAKRGKHLTKKNRKEDDNLTEPTPEEIEATLSAYNQKALIQKWKEGKAKIDPRLVAVLNGKLHFRPVAIPCGYDYEPWSIDLLRYIQKHKTLSFFYSRQQLRNIIQSNLKSILPPVAITDKGGSHNPKNVLRHWRISHLVTYYNFAPADLAAYTGWSVATAFAKAGQTGGSPNMEHYIHLVWRSYLPKLLRNIDDLMR
jgi:hypothetical protein